MALACDQILLIDDNSSAVALPEVPLLGVLPGTGGLTRVIDKRRVRKDRADVFATKSEGLRGKQAVEWRLVDEVDPQAPVGREGAPSAPPTAAAALDPPGRTRAGIALPPLQRTETADGIAYRHVAGHVRPRARASSRSPCSARRATCPTPSSGCTSSARTSGRWP